MVCSCRHTKNTSFENVQRYGVKQMYFTPYQWKLRNPVNENLLTLEAWMNLDALLGDREYYVNIIKFENNFVRKYVDYIHLVNEQLLEHGGEDYVITVKLDPWDFAEYYPQELVRDYRKKFNTHNVFLFDLNVLVMFSNSDIGPFSKYIDD